MTPTERQKRKRRLERAGFVYVAGWLKPEFAKRVLAQIEAYRDAAERTAAAEPPRGRPKK